MTSPFFDITFSVRYYGSSLNSKKFRLDIALFVHYHESSQKRKRREHQCGERLSLSVTLWMIAAPLKAKAQTNDPPPSGSCYVFSPRSSSIVEYSRRKMIVWEITPTSATDYDFTPWGLDENFVIIVGWTDFMEGEEKGEFGYSPDGYNFYPVNNPEMVNAYLPKPGFVGILKIAPILDDIPIGIYSGMPTHDDDSVTGDPWKMTVWEFWITDGAYGWVPSLDSELTFTAWIEPTVDHKGQSMASIIIFFLNASAEPGYCMNATPQNGQWDDTIGSDLKFHIDQPDPRVFRWDETTAGTWVPTTDATVKVICLDYGAHSGSLTAIATIAGENAIARLTRDGRSWVIELGIAFYYAPIPWDMDHNFISDFAGVYDWFFPI
ncbi:hypothetical protein [Fervidibacter sacchari]